MVASVTKYIFQTVCGDYLADDHLNTQRSYAKRFATREEAKAAADKMHVAGQVQEE